MSHSRINLYDFTREALRQQLVRWGFNGMHVRRLWAYLYLELKDSFDDMPDLPAKVRARLTAGARLGRLPTALETDSSDGFTRKYLLALADGERIETVLMRYSGRVTACVSSQVGCAMGCVFCATGQMGYTRHLTPGEIVAQAVHVARALREPRTTVGTCHLLGDKSPRALSIAIQHRQVGGGQVESGQLGRRNPLQGDMLEWPGLRASRGQVADEGNHLDEDGVGVSETRQGAGDDDVATEFLLDLADDGGLGCFVRLNLAAGELPFKSEVFVRRALRGEHVAVALDHGADNRNGNGGRMTHGTHRAHGNENAQAGEAHGRT